MSGRQFLPVRTLSKIACISGLIVLFGMWAAPLSKADDPPQNDAVGAIEGDAIAVDGPMSVEVVKSQVKTVLRSGSDVRVKAGQARIDLVEGGHISICGPAHFSVLKSGGSLTVALESGTIHAFIQNEPALTVYTPQIQARPVSIGGGTLETLVGVDGSGAMCIRATKGAVRIEQQLTGQSLLVPQNGDVSLSNGQLESLKTSVGRCVCEAATLSKTPTISTEVSALASSEELKKRSAERKSNPPQNDSLAPTEEKPEPVYQVLMPPLQYDAKAKVQADYDPNLILLVRRVRVRPTLIFQGKVEGAPVADRAAASPTSEAGNTLKIAAPKPAEETTWNRVRTFFKKLLGPSS